MIIMCKVAYVQQTRKVVCLWYFNICFNVKRLRRNSNHCIIPIREDNSLKYCTWLRHFNLEVVTQTCNMWTSNIIYNVCPSKFCITFVFNISRVLFNSIYLYKFVQADGDCLSNMVIISKELVNVDAKICSNRDQYDEFTKNANG